MSYTIIWDESAINAAARFLQDDPEGLRQLMDAVDLLANSPARRAAPSTAPPTSAGCTSAATA
ncbi:hypothetical protein ACFQ2M_41815 [Kitasatospora saccharophila]|uniref:hypothetical protein n=1 Tax=Kitasatospora saccharophila TaxID=407973 RepID=UPI00363BB69C